MFKTELHCHSNDVSQCARVDSCQIVQKFTEAGYNTVVLANHFNSDTMRALGAADWNDWIDKYLDGYYNLKKEAQVKLNILLGMELRFDENINDYLVFGITEEFLRNNQDILTMNPERVHKLAKENGCLFIQAHPFRNGMTVIYPHHLDGVEVFNGHSGHDSRNEIANMWADKYGLIKTSGTDFHYIDSPANGGIFTNEEITSMPQLVQILNSGEYTLNKQ